jgi:DNA repair protein RadC
MNPPTPPLRQGSGARSELSSSASTALSALFAPRYPLAARLQMADSLLIALGGLRGLTQATTARLSRHPGVGPFTARRIQAALQIGRLVHTRPLRQNRPIRSSQEVAAAFGARFQDKLQEYFLALALDARNRPLGEVFRARGTLSSCPVQPSDIFRELLLHGAPGVVFLHNHPSGDPSPSIEDLRLTERLCKCADLLGIRVMDHVIIGRQGHFSFLDAGLLGLDLPSDPEYALDDLKTLRTCQNSLKSAPK